MPLRPPEQAIAIYQDLLDRINLCYANRDFGAFQEMVHVPHHIRTPEKTYVLRDDAHLRSMFDTFIEHKEQLGVETFHRRCTGAKFKGAHRIEGEHETHFLRGTQYIEPISKVRSMLMKVNQSWMVCASDNRVEELSASSLSLETTLKRTIGRTGFDNAPNGEETAK